MNERFLENERECAFEVEFNRACNGVEWNSSNDRIFVHTVENRSNLKYLKNREWKAKFILTEDRKLRIGAFGNNTSPKAISHPALREMGIGHPTRVISAGYIGRTKFGKTYILPVSGHFRPEYSDLASVYNILQDLGLRPHKVKMNSIKHVLLKLFGVF